MKQSTLLLCAGLLTLVGTLPASATPVLDAAQLVSQAAINPIYMNVEGIENTSAALHEAVDLIDEVENPSAALTRIKCGDVIMERIFQEILDEGTQGKKNRRNINADDTLKAVFKRLASNSQDLSEFAALGWDMSEKKAASKLAGFAKGATGEQMHDAVLAILTGLLEVSRTESTGKYEEIADAQLAAREGWIEIIAVSHE